MMIKTFFKWLSIQMDKFHTGHGNQFLQWGCGKWYVEYHSGDRSMTMWYNTAKHYAEIFGGEVKHYSELPKNQY